LASPLVRLVTVTRRLFSPSAAPPDRTVKVGLMLPHELGCHPVAVVEVEVSADPLAIRLPAAPPGAVVVGAAVVVVAAVVVGAALVVVAAVVVGAAVVVVAAVVVGAIVVVGAAVVVGAIVVVVVLVVVLVVAGAVPVHARPTSSTPTQPTLEMTCMTLNARVPAGTVNWRCAGVHAELAAKVPSHPQLVAPVVLVYSTRISVITLLRYCSLYVHTDPGVTATFSNHHFASPLVRLVTSTKRLLVPSAAPPVRTENDARSDPHHPLRQPVAPVLEESSTDGFATRFPTTPACATLGGPGAPGSTGAAVASTHTAANSPATRRARTPRIVAVDRPSVKIPCG